VKRPLRVCLNCFKPSVVHLMLVINVLCFVAVITKREISQAVGMLTMFKYKLKEKRGIAGTGPPPADTARVGSSSKNPKKRTREGGNTARTYRVPGEMSIPPLRAECPSMSAPHNR